MSTSTQDISTAFNAATGLSNSAMMKMLAFGILALIVIFFTASALIALSAVVRNQGRNGAELWIQLLVIMCGISMILLFFSLL